MELDPYMQLVEKGNDSPCTVDNESNSLHATTTDDLSDGVTLAVADSTTPEVDTHFEKVATAKKQMSTLYVCL